jgi:hypothetical protein
MPGSTMGSCSFLSFRDIADMERSQLNSQVHWGDIRSKKTGSSVAYNLQSTNVCVGWMCFRKPPTQAIELLGTCTRNAIAKGIIVCKRNTSSHNAITNIAYHATHILD